MEKTNVLRILDKAGIVYKAYEYACDKAPSATEVAAILNIEEIKIYKTLVTVGSSRQHYVFVIPSAFELDLKKAAKAAGEKNIAMVKAKELLPLTSYVHGGCSPIGMKKFFPTFIERLALQQDTIVISAGRIGHQVELSVTDLQKVISFSTEDLC